MATRKLTNYTIDPVEATVMGFREYLVSYYKGSHTENFVYNSGINATNDEPRRPYQYQRQLQELHQTRILRLMGTRLMKVSKQPDKVILFDNNLLRSPELQQLRKGIEQFIAKYLPYVEVKSNGKHPRELKDSDINLFSARVQLSGYSYATGITYYSAFDRAVDISTMSREEMEDIMVNMSNTHE